MTRRPFWPLVSILLCFPPMSCNVAQDMAGFPSNNKKWLSEHSWGKGSGNPFPEPQS